MQSEDEPQKTLADKWLGRLKNHKVIAALVVIGAIAAAVNPVIELYKKIFGSNERPVIAAPPAPPSPRCGAVATNGGIAQADCREVIQVIMNDSTLDAETKRELARMRKELQDLTNRLNQMVGAKLNGAELFDKRLEQIEISAPQDRARSARELIAAVEDLKQRVGQNPSPEDARLLFDLLQEQFREPVASSELASGKVLPAGATITSIPRGNYNCTVLPWNEPNVPTFPFITEAPKSGPDVEWRSLGLANQWLMAARLCASVMHPGEGNGNFCRAAKVIRKAGLTPDWRELETHFQRHNSSPNLIAYTKACYQ